MRGYWCLNGIKIDNTTKWKWKCLPMAYHYAQTYMLKVNKIRRRLRCPKSHDQHSIFEKSVNSLREKPLSNRSEAWGGHGCFGKRKQFLTNWLFLLCESSKSLLETDNSEPEKHTLWLQAAWGAVQTADGETGQWEQTHSPALDFLILLTRAENIVSIVCSYIHN